MTRCLCDTTVMKRVRLPYTQRLVVAKQVAARRDGHCLRVQASQAAGEVSEQERIASVRVETTRRITKLGRAGRPKEATLQLAEMARLGVQPDRMAATALVDACVRNNKMDMASNVFEELFGELLEPDDITFSVLVRGYGNCRPPSWSDISSTLSTMQQRYQMKPGPDVYRALLEICVRTKDDDRGYEIIERMARAGVGADPRVWDAVRPRKALRSHFRRVYNDTGGLSEDEDFA